MNRNDFYIATLADWKLEKVLSLHEAYLMKQDFDFVSPSGSAYKYTNEGVYRISNHWVHNVASCNWTINGSFYNESRPLLGFCKWEDFSRMISKRDDGGAYYLHNREFHKIA